MDLREIFSSFRQQWHLHRLEAARERLDILLRTTPRYWTAASIGGMIGLDLGKMTHQQALDSVIALGHKIAHVDIEGAFIALEGKPDVQEPV